MDKDTEVFLQPLPSRTEVEWSGTQPVCTRCQAQSVISQGKSRERTGGLYRWPGHTRSVPNETRANPNMNEYCRSIVRVPPLVWSIWRVRALRVVLLETTCIFSGNFKCLLFFFFHFLLLI